MGGDFNMALSGEEKIRGFPMVDADFKSLKTYIESCYFTQVPYKGISFTWWNRRAVNTYIFERSNRALINFEFHQLFSHTEFEHLPRNRSICVLLLLNC